MCRPVDSLANLLFVVPMLIVMVILFPLILLYFSICDFIKSWVYARNQNHPTTLVADRDSCFFNKEIDWVQLTGCIKGKIDGRI
jgi:hypothetical protein